MTRRPMTKQPTHYTIEVEFSCVVEFSIDAGSREEAIKEARKRMRGLIADGRFPNYVPNDVQIDRATVTDGPKD